MSWEHIPEELRALPQWACAGKDKRPLNPKDQSAASPTDRSTWGTFEEACQAGADYIGFVLTPEDPYCVIDLDRPRNDIDRARHEKILDAFPTYTEYSISGHGYHIVCQGKLPEGARRDKVEMYSSARFIICTGEVLKDLPIVDCQEMLDLLYAEIKRSTTSAAAVDEEESLTDAEIVDMAMRANNATKFNSLCAGEWGDYPSQSEADMALMSQLAFYSQNNEQVKRLFRMSGLGKRDKAQKNDTYLNYAIKRIRSNQPPPIDFGTIRQRADAFATGISEPAVPPERPRTFPKGLVGEVATFILEHSIRPVPDIALAGAIAFVAGICGRSYNISGTGLNQYLLLLAKTGTGKEGAMQGIEALVAAIRTRVPMVDQFIGPATFASGQALIKQLDDRPCFVSVLGEFGLTLQQLSSPQANSATVMLKKVLLDLYAKSGSASVLRSSVYADSEKNTKMVRSPALTILGESTPEAFYDGLSAIHIAEGLLPRFLTLEYTGGRPPRNYASHQPPEESLVNALVKLVTLSLTMAANQATCQVKMDDHARAILDALDQECDRKINAHSSDVEAQLWNRAHLKALKLAALLAVGSNMDTPVITAEHARWATATVKAEVVAVSRRFIDGDVGTGDSKQIYLLQQITKEYLQSPAEVSAKYGVHLSSKMIEARIIPYAYYQRRTASVSSFRLDRLGATNALKRSLTALVDGGFLAEIPKNNLVERYGFRGLAFGMVVLTT